MGARIESGRKKTAGCRPPESSPAGPGTFESHQSIPIARYDVTRPGGVPVQTLEFTSQSSRLYRVETRLSLATGVWQDAGFGLFQVQPVSTFLNLGSPALPQRFYQVSVQRPLAP